MIDDPELSSEPEISSDTDTVVNIYQHPVLHLFITCSAPVLHAFDVCGMGAESLTLVLLFFRPWFCLSFRAAVAALLLPRAG